MDEQDYEKLREEFHNSEYFHFLLTIEDRETRLRTAKNLWKKFIAK